MAADYLSIFDYAIFDATVFDSVVPPMVATPHTPIRLPVYTIRVLHPVTYQPILDLDEYLSLTYTDSWGRFGTFELKMSASTPNVLRAMQLGAVIAVLRDGIPEFYGWSDSPSLELSENDESGFVWTTSGWNAPGDVVSRVTLPSPDIYTDASTVAGADADEVSLVTVAEAMRWYVHRNMIDPAEPTRIMPNLNLGEASKPNRFPPLSFFSPEWAVLPRETVVVESTEEWTTVSYKARFHEVPELLTALSKASGAGWKFRLTPDTQQIYFDVLKGADRREGTLEGYREALFALSRDNLARFTYQNPGADIKNTVYAAAGGETTTRTVTTHKQTGEVYTWVNANPMGDPFVVSQSLQMRGRREAAIDVRNGAADVEAAAFLQEHADQQSLTFRTRETLVDQFRRHFDVGDLVSVRFVLSDGSEIAADARIEEAKVTLTPDRPPEIDITVGAKPRSVFTMIREFARSTRATKFT